MEHGQCIHRVVRPLTPTHAGANELLFNSINSNRDYYY